MPKETFFNLPDDKRRRILDVVIDEFADNDYANVSISKIVTRAGIAKGSFYQYFEDKDDLSAYLVSYIAEIKAKAFSLDHPDPERVGIFNYMRWMIANSAEFELAYPRLSRIGYRMLNGNANENKIFAQAMENAQHYYVTLVTLGKAQGDIDPELDDEMAATVFRVVLSEMGRHIVQRIVAQYGTDWQGEQAIFDFPEARRMYEQLLQVIEFGLGNRR
jgi:TetR/AcrR family transcriptional regulator